jgi:hypothetical protein
VRDYSQSKGSGFVPLPFVFSANHRALSCLAFRFLN